MSQQRSLAPDLARGFMLLLIALAHAPLFLVEADRSVLFRPRGGTPLDELCTFLGLVLVDNRAYPLFALLLGYGMAMMVRRRLETGRPPTEALRLLRRRGWYLLLFGLLNAALIHPADILGPYGLMILLIGSATLITDQRLSMMLAATSVVYLATVPLYAHLLERVLLPAMAEGDNVFAIENYLAAVLTRAVSYPLTPPLVLVGYPLVFLALVGVWAARRGVLDQPARHRKLLQRTAVIGIGLSTIGALPLAIVAVGWWNPAVSCVAWLTALHVLTGIFGGFGYVAIFGLLCIQRDRLGNRAIGWLAATGRRSLTAYLMQALILAAILSPPLLGLGARLHATGALLAGAFAWLAAVSMCAALQRLDRPGPADALLRRLTEGRRSV